MSDVTKILILALCVALVASMPTFPDYIPNGRNVYFKGSKWTAVGHNVRNEGTGFNPFGMAVRATLTGGFPDWSKVCDLDSDGDGISNGEELGDPNCEWRNSADNGILTTDNATHPGFGSAVPGNPKYLKIHAAFMCVAWLFFAPLGILTAVIYKVKVPMQPQGFDWFKIHKLCLGTCVYLTLVAYVLVVYKQEEFLLKNTHTRIGHAVVILSIIQPISGFWRLHIHKDGSKSMLRLAWEFLHQWTGRSMVVLAAIAIYFGFHQEAAGQFDNQVREGMKLFSVIWWGVLLIVYQLIVITRVDERKKPSLPVKKADAPKATNANTSTATSDTNNANANVGEIPAQPGVVTKGQSEAPATVQSGANQVSKS